MAEKEAWLGELRQQFPAVADTTFVDIAYGNTGALFADEALHDYLADWRDVSPQVVKGNAGGKGRQIEIIAETRSRAAKLVNAEDDNHIAFTKNTNEALNFVLESLPLDGKSQIITDTLEHSNVLFPVLNQKRHGVDVKLVETPQDILHAIDDRTRVVVVSHVLHATGYRVDLQKLGDECHRRGIYLLVDAVQSLGVHSFDVQKWHVDLVTAATYKSLLGIEGTAFAYVSSRLAQSLTPVYAAANPFLSWNSETQQLVVSDRKDARLLENSSIPVPGLYVLNESLKRIEKIGVKNIEEHVDRLVTKLYDGLIRQGYELVTSPDPNHRCHIVSIKVDDPEGMYEWLRKQGVYASYSADKYVRLSVAAFTDDEDIDKTLETTSQYVSLR